VLGNGKDCITMIDVEILNCHSYGTEAARYHDNSDLLAFLHTFVMDVGVEGVRIF
jgi:hypothetical protein